MNCRLVFFLMAVTVTASASATSHTAELEQALPRLLHLLSGEFDSQTQLLAEKQAGTPEALVHGWVNRSFTRIDAPDVGEHVVVTAVRYGGRDGSFDNGEFQVWTLSVDTQRNAIKMSPRRFREPERWIAFSRDAAALAGLGSDDLLPPQGAAGCDILWQPDGKHLQGTTDPALCVAVSSTLNVPLSWEWRYLLEADALWISFAGRNEAGDIVNGRQDRLPWRLDRLE
jgi:hypothetical protein